MRIREVDANGVSLNTIAGGGTNSGTDGLGDGGPATGAQFVNPVAVAADGIGNLFIADYNGNRIREVFAGNGLIMTVAGTGQYARNGEYSCSCDDGGPATNGGLSHPGGVAAESAGNLYIADDVDFRIREVSGLPPYPPGFSTFVVADASSGNAGNYSVVITTLNTGVSVTSSPPAVLSVGPVQTRTGATINIMPLGDSVTARGGAPESGYRYWLYAYLTNAGFSNTVFVGSQTGTDVAVHRDRPPQTFLAADIVCRRWNHCGFGPRC